MPLSPAMISFTDARARNPQGQFMGNQTGGADPNSMAAAYGGQAQNKQSQVQKILSALKLRKPVIPAENPMLSSTSKSIRFAMLLKNPILRRKKGLLQRRIYGLAPSGMKGVDYAPQMCGNLHAIIDKIEFAELKHIAGNVYHDGNGALYDEKGKKLVHKNGLPAHKYNEDGSSVIPGKPSHQERGARTRNAIGGAVVGGGIGYVAGVRHGGAATYNAMKRFRLSSRNGLTQFGIGADLLEKAGAFFAGNAGKSMVGHGAIGAGIGSVLGGGKALVHNIVDPQNHESVLGGALGGAALGGMAGAGYGAYKSTVPTGLFKAGEEGGALVPHTGDLPAGNPKTLTGSALAKAQSHPDFSHALYPSPTNTNHAIPVYKGNGVPTFNQPGSKPGKPIYGPGFSALRPGMISFEGLGALAVLDDIPALLAARRASKKKSGEVNCPECNESFNHSEQQESSMGSVACPSCGAQVSQDGINSEEVPSGVPSGEMLPAASSQSQPIFDKAQTVETSRINGVAESAQGDVDPQDPWSDSRAVNITNNPEFINGKKRPAPASVSMSSLRPGMIEMGRGDMIRKVFPGAPIPQRGVIPHVSKGIAQGVRNRLKAKKLLEGKILPPAGYMPDGRRLF